jgi:YD repeat-containing protein
MGRLAAAMALLSSPGCAAPDACEDCVDGCIYPMFREAQQAGWRMGTTRDFDLAAGASQGVSLIVVPGATYRLLACGDEAFRDLEIVVHDRAGRLVARDGRPGRAAALDYDGAAGNITASLWAADLADAAAHRATLVVVER